MRVLCAPKIKFLSLVFLWFSFFPCMLFLVFFCAEKQQLVRFRCSSNNGIKAKGFCERPCLWWEPLIFLCFAPLRMLFFQELVEQR